MKKKFLQMFIGVILAVTLLAGCAAPAGPAGTTTAAPEATTAAPEATTAAPETTTAAPEATTAAPAATTAAPEATTAAAEGPVPVRGEIILATTTSTEDSGLLAFILPAFTSETGWEVKTIAVGTGIALQMGRDGEADVLLVHARAQEDQFVADGYAEARFDVMYNDFVIVGPSDGPIAHNEDVGETFRTIFESQLDFVSRGDGSGTHTKELEIWDSIGIDPEGNPSYVSAGQGMGATLGIAVEMRAFTLSDRATWLNYADTGDLIVVCEKSEILLNPYGVIPVSASVSDHINTEGAQAFVDWITGESGQALIRVFGVDQFGEPLFIPDA